MNLELFDRHTIAEHAESIAGYLPGGRIFEGSRIPGTNYNDLLKGFAVELQRVEQLLIQYVFEHGIETTTLFIREWEVSLGMPDECFPTTGDLDERRSHILIKLASLGVQTNSDFVNLAALLGFEVTINSGIEEMQFPIQFPTVMFTDLREARFTIIVRFEETTPTVFPLTFPIIFGDVDISILECLFSKLIPSNCQLIFIST